MRALASLLAAGALLGCVSPSGNLERTRAENELLKAQIEVIKRNCSYYREVEVEAEEEGR